MLIFISCKKENNNHPLTQEQKRIQLNKDAALIMAKVVGDIEVRQEIYESVRAITKQYEWRDEAVYFKEILPNNYNTILNKESKIALAVRKELGKNNSGIPLNTSSNKKTTNESLQFINDLIAYDIEFYFPYHEDFPTPENFAVTYQNEISEDENEGFNYINNNQETVLVNDNYATKNPTLVIGQFNNNRYETTSIPDNKRTTGLGDPIWIDLGYIKATDPHEGILKGAPEFRINCTDISILGSSATAFPTTELAINMTRKEAKNGTPKRQWIIFDHSWELLELNKRIEVYEDDRDGIMGDIKNLFFPIQVELPGLGVITVTAGKQISTKDEDLGHISYNRIMFFNTNLNNSNFGHGKDPDGWPFYYHGGGFFYTLPRIYN